MRQRASGLLLLVVLAVAHGAAQSPPPVPAGEWRYYGGDAGSRKYSPLDQIAAANVDRLRVAWQWTSADDAVVAANPTARPGAYQDTPLMANGVLYTVTSLGQVAALDPGTGVARWVFDPGQLEERPARQPRLRASRPGLLDRRHQGAAAARHRRCLPAGDRRPHRRARSRRSATTAASI